MDNLGRMDSMDTLLVNAEEPSASSSQEEVDGLDDPDLYFGEKAVDNFWDFYKSDRKFKDFNSAKQEIEDPRQAYFQTCKEMGVFPRAKLIIRDEHDPVVEYVNV